MISIKNNSSEDLEIVEGYDPDAPGFRLVVKEMNPNVLGPGQELTLLDYEPGVSYTIRPVNRPELPRIYGITENI